MIVDLPVADFCRSKAIGELTGIEFTAANAKLSMFKFHDCWVDLHRLFPIAGGLQTCKALFRTYADRKYGNYYSEQFESRLRGHAAFDYEHVFVLGGTRNYWHFLVDHLGKMPLLRYFDGAAPDIVVSERLTSGFAQLVERACAYLGLQQPRLVTEARPMLKLKDSFVPCVNDAAPRLRFLRQFGVSTQTADGSAAPERIFFRRGGVSQRRVQNESEVEERLVQEFDFVAVEPGAKPVLEQVDLVRNAKIIVGGHGAALANLIFASKLGSLVELYVWHTQPFLKGACDHLGVEHHFLRGDPVGSRSASGSYARLDNQDYTVPVEQLLKLVDAIASRRGHAGGQKPNTDGR